MSNNVIHHPSSYRDPSGFIYENRGVIYRQVNYSFKEHFDHFIQSGCYDHLVKNGLLIPHQEVELNEPGSGYKNLRPERIELISYPYEWSFDMLKDAALLTLQLVREGLKYDMILKDATPYNIQMHKGRLVFIDTLSFEKHQPVPWIAYRQFCECFLGPLLIMHYSNTQLQGLLLGWPNGIPLAAIASLLPPRSRFSLHTYLHIHLHAKMSKKKQDGPDKVRSLSKQKLLNLIGSLELLINKLRSPSQRSTWSEYYTEASQRNDYLDQKKQIIKRWLDEINEKNFAIDLGANEGEFSKLLAEKNIFTVAADFDPYCINRLYLTLKTNKNENIHPLVLDFSNPSPATGVNNQERNSFIDRIHADLVIALALIHHLAIGKNIPFELIAQTMKPLGKNLIIEFVPKADDKVRLMLEQKKDIYSDYDEAGFLRAFSHHYVVVKKEPIPGSQRVLYLMKRNEG